MWNVITRLGRDDAGQDLIEYALLAAFVALGSVAALILLGPAIKTFSTPSSRNSARRQRARPRRACNPPRCRGQSR